MDSVATQQTKRQKLERGLRAAGFAAIAIAVVIFIFSVACYFALWHYRRDGTLDSDGYDSMVYALKLVVFAFLPCIGAVLLGLGVHILYFLRRQKSLLNDDHDA